MALRMVSRFFLSYGDAVRAMADLTTAGIPDADISLIESEDDARLPVEVTADAAQSPAITGATLGMGIGGGIGALIGIGSIPVPFLDPLVAFGWVVPTVVGAVIGAALGALVGKVTRLGVTNVQAHSFAAGLQRGEHLVMVRVDESRVAQVEAILARTPAPVTVVEAPLPPEPLLTPEETRAAIHRDEARIQYE